MSRAAADHRGSRDDARAELGPAKSVRHDLGELGKPWTTASWRLGYALSMDGLHGIAGPNELATEYAE